MTQSSHNPIEFYKDHFDYVNSFGLVHFEREDRNLFRQGLKLIEDALTVEKKEKAIRKQGISVGYKEIKGQPIGCQTKVQGQWEP